jgi:hypothetical protein
MCRRSRAVRHIRRRTDHCSSRNGVRRPALRRSTLRSTGEPRTRHAGTLTLRRRRSHTHSTGSKHKLVPRGWLPSPLHTEGLCRVRRRAAYGHTLRSSSLHGRSSMSTVRSGHSHQRPLQAPRSCLSRPRAPRCPPLCAQHRRRRCLCLGRPASRAPTWRTALCATRIPGRARCWLSIQAPAAPSRCPARPCEHQHRQLDRAASRPRRRPHAPLARRLDAAVPVRRQRAAPHSAALAFARTAYAVHDECASRERQHARPVRANARQVRPRPRAERSL